MIAGMAEIEENSVGIVKTETIRVVEQDEPLELACGKMLAPVDVAYETYGQLNEAADNVVLLCHALSGNAHAAGYNSADDKKKGWWSKRKLTKRGRKYVYGTMRKTGWKPKREKR